MTYISRYGSEEPVGEIKSEDFEAFNEWLTLGIERGWVSRMTCATHDMLPATPTEEDEMEEGGDPCIEVLRVWAY